MPHLNIFFSFTVTALMLAQYQALRLVFGRRPAAALVSYRRFVLGLALMLGTGAFQGYLFANVLAVDAPRWDQEGVAYLARILGGDPVRLGLFLLESLSMSVFSPGVLLWLVPPLVLDLVSLEGIPLSRRQIRACRLTRRIGALTIACLCALNAVYFARVLGAPVPDSITGGLSSLVNGLATVLTFGLLVAWAVHAAQARVLTAFPRIARAFRVGAYLSGVFSLALILSVLIQAFHLPVPGLGDLIRAGGPYVLQEHLLITGTWAVLGLLALKRHLPDPLVPTQPAAGATAAVPAAAEPDFEALFRAHGLSGREAAIASLVATGAGNKEIAVRLDISYHTVKNHVASIFRKTGVGNRFELVRFVASGRPSV